VALGLEIEAYEEAIRFARSTLEAAEKREKAGAGTQVDVLQFRLERDQAETRLTTARRRLEAARKVLALAVGLPTLDLSGERFTFDSAAPAYDWSSLREIVLARSSEIRTAQAALLQAEQQLLKAQAERTPNVQVLVHPFYAFPEEDSRLKVEVGAPLPIFNRNQGNITSARAELARAAEEVRQVELRITERLAGAYQRYQSAAQQVRAYEQRIVPAAREFLRLVRLGYESNDPRYDQTALWQAQNTLVQARLAQVQSVAELWRAVADIAGLLQQDQLGDISAEPQPDASSGHR
jgi:cobalt-zinc-cadmium efflux system outer membrane protein